MYDIKQDDVKGYERVHNAMNKVGLSDDEKMHIFRVATAVLQLGNISFEGKEDSQGKICGFM